MKEVENIEGNMGLFTNGCWRLSSEIGARGIFKKILIFTLVGVAYMIDSRIIGDGSAIRTAVIFFISPMKVSVLLRMPVESGYPSLKN